MTENIYSAESIIATELQVQPTQVAAAIQLMDDGATVPFIARYRKEATGLNDVQLRQLEERLYYLRELDARRQVILESIRSQDKLTPTLEQSILQADSKSRLEDLYLPFKPKRRTKATQAIEAGLEPLAQSLFDDPSLNPLTAAAAFINPEADINDAEAALAGAKDILVERFAEEATLIDTLREYLWRHGILQSVGDASKDSKNKYRDYLSYQEAIKKIPSHRALALFRARRESVLRLSLILEEKNQDYGESTIAAYFQIRNEGRATDAWLSDCVKQAWQKKLSNKIELELFARLREKAEDEAIKVFARNLRDLLLAAPAGDQVVMGLDPGIRTGVKVAIVDKTGQLLDWATIFPHAPKNEWHEAIVALAKLAAKHQVQIISIGNGTASRETERLVSELIKMYPDLTLNKMLVSEAGASVYSASEMASEEFPDLDVSLRGAVSIARRLQDPLAELVKIDAKAIGVGQYQHDVNQTKLARALEAVVEDCVNQVGVELNTASAALLAQVSGLNKGLAEQIIQHRNNEGPFKTREALKSVARFGEKTFEQSAGFLRIRNGDNPLDASAVHPEAYPLVERILADKGVSLKELIGNKQVLQSISPATYTDERFGLVSVQDVLTELEKPGRDPRPAFKMVAFKEGVEDIKQLKAGMILEGVVSNVTNFGAFVDIGVHQDGLVHISSMTDKFVSDPHQIVKTGDVLTVKVTAVDQERKRISLSMNLADDAETKPRPAQKAKHKPSTQAKKPAEKKQAKTHKTSTSKKPVFNTAMADALAKLKKG